MTSHPPGGRPDNPTGPNTTAAARAKQDRLKKSKDLLNPGHNDPRQRWLLVRLWPHDNRPGEFFVTHAENLPKFDRDPRFKVHAIADDRARLTYIARRWTIEAGPAYQPPTSAVHRLPPPTGPDPEDHGPPTTTTPQQETKK